MLHSNVQPPRIVREPRKEPWTCGGCGTLNAPYWARCPTLGCGKKRPA